MSQEARHLRDAIDRPVRVGGDDGKERPATLIGPIGPRGVRVRYANGQVRTVAAWRITVEEHDEPA